MSSEESGIDDNEEVIITRPLSLLSANVQHLFKKLDAETMAQKSP